MDKKLLIYYDEDSNGYDGSCYSKIDTGIFSKKFINTYKFRAVAGYSELKEKILIYDNDLSDIYVEQLKYGIANSFLLKNPGKKTPVLLFNKKTNNSIEFFIGETGKQGHIMSYSLEECETIKKYFPIKARLFKEGDCFINIDHNWIANNLKKKR